MTFYTDSNVENANALCQYWDMTGGVGGKYWDMTGGVGGKYWDMTGGVGGK